jgi:non-homologous end joining protein Ku
VHKPNVATRLAVEFAGFPVNVALYTRVRKQRNESFRTLTPKGVPIASVYTDPTTGKPVPAEKQQKGVQTGPDEYTVIPPEVIEQINAGTKTTVAKLRQLAPVETIAWDLAIDRFAVLPDDKVAGADQSTNVLWNGLRDSGTAYVTQVSIRAGMDAILAIYADDRGLWGALLPFEAELYEFPVHEFTEDAEQSALFSQVAEQMYGEQVENFDHSAYRSEYKARREALIEQALEGGEVVQNTPSGETAVPDLMSALRANIAANREQEAVAA